MGLPNGDLARVRHLADDFAAYYESGHSINETATRFGCTASTAYRMLKKVCGVTFRFNGGNNGESMFRPNDVVRVPVDQRRALGVCKQCCRPLPEKCEFVMCEHCREWHIAYGKKKRATNRKSKKCIDCDNQVFGLFRRCEACSAVRKAKWHEEHPVRISKSPGEAVLRSLYIDQRLSTYKIGKILGVSQGVAHTWLENCGIETRRCGSGLVHRGLVAPTKEEIYDLVYVQHLTYEVIAAKYGAASSTVKQWLKKHGFRSPGRWDKRHKGIKPEAPPKDELIGIYESGQTLADLAIRYMVSHTTVKKWFIGYGLAGEIRDTGFGNRIECSDGHIVRSLYEMRVDEWLSARSIPYEYEPRTPFPGRFKSDFLVNGWYVEIWGLVGNEKYDRRKAIKTALYKAHSCALIDLYPWHFHQGTWESRLAIVLEVPGVKPKQAAFSFMD